MALQARNDWRVAVCHWHYSFFWQPLPAECEWCKVVRRDYAAWRISISGWLGMHSVGGVESVSESGQMNIFALPP